MDYEGFLELAEEELTRETAQKEGSEELKPELFVTAVTTINPPRVQSCSDDNKAELVIIITKEM